MNPEQVDWYAKTNFYILDVNGMTKFGITSNWDRRLRQYLAEFPGMKITLIKKEIYPTRWEAELLEQVIKWRLRPWVKKGRHEYMYSSVQLVLKFHKDTRDRLRGDFHKYEHIHEFNNDRWDHYRDIAKYQFRARHLDGK